MLDKIIIWTIRIILGGVIFVCAWAGVYLVGVALEIIPDPRLTHPVEQTHE